MPSEFSVYRKIQIVLDVAKSVRLHSVPELADQVQGLKLDNFLTRHYDAEEDSFVIGTSKKSIGRVIDLCEQLDLIADNGRLTDAGRRALRKTDFDAVIAFQLRSFLGRQGVSLSGLNRAIFKNLRSDPPVLTTTRELWSVAGGTVSYPTFARMLTLLAQCGGAQVSQKKVYLQVIEE